MEKHTHKFYRNGDVGWINGIADDELIMREACFFCHERPTRWVIWRRVGLIDEKTKKPTYEK